MKSYHELTMASFGMFGGNAKRSLKEVKEELKSRGIERIPNLLGDILL